MSSSLSSLSSFSLFLLSILIICNCLPNVLSESDFQGVIRLPTDDSPICTGPIPNTCPVNCFRTDPVCGVDGVTYWCGCADAYCAGTKVAKLGFCEVGNGGNGHVSGQALLLVHIVWLIVLGFSVLFGIF